MCSDHELTTTGSLCFFLIVKNILDELFSPSMHITQILSIDFTWSTRFESITQRVSLCFTYVKSHSVTLGFIMLELDGGPSVDVCQFI